MNISPLTIYLWQMADGFSHTADVFFFISGILTVFLLMLYGWARIFECPDDEEAKNNNELRQMRKVAKGLVPFFFIAGLVSNLVPNSKTIAMMVVIPEIAHSKVVQQDLPDIYNAAVKALKDQLAK